MIERIVNQVRNLNNSRPAPYSEVSVEIKDKIRGSRYVGGILEGYHINDMIKCRNEVSRFYRDEGSEQEGLINQFRRLQPRVVVSDEDDPFI